MDAMESTPLPHDPRLDGQRAHVSRDMHDEPYPNGWRVWVCAKNFSAHYLAPTRDAAMNLALTYANADAITVDETDPWQPVTTTNEASTTC